KYGTPFADAMVAQGRKGGGVTEYYWEKPGGEAGDVYLKATYTKAFEPWNVVVGTGVYIYDLETEISRMAYKALAIGAAVVVLGLLTAWFVIRGITRPLAAIHGALGAVADENVSISIPHTDMGNEVGMMAKATLAL